MGSGVFDGFADGDAEAAAGIWIFFEDGFAGVGECGRAWEDFCSPVFHEDAAIWFLFIAAFYHIYTTL